MQVLLTLAAALMAPAGTGHGDHHAQTVAAPPTAATIEARKAAIADPRRAADAARDMWRHPAETLEFCKVDPGMTVVDTMPGGGWWTKILVPYLGTSGRYIALNPNVRSAEPQMQKYLGGLATSFPPKAAEWTGVSADRIGAYNSDGVTDAMAGTVDRVMIMRQVHNIQRFGMLYRELGTARRLLKDGGLLCIEEHRARPDAPAAYVDGSKGYMREKDVIGLVEAHGFELIGRSEVNANPKDTADWPDGVWTLPPNLRLGDKDRARYTAIGESDRMTLKFVKPR